MTGRRRFRKFDDKKLEALRTVKLFAVLIVVFALLFSCVIGVSRVDGLSMFPTLKNEQTVVYNRLAKNYERGDIVSVRMPNGQYYIKRVIAVGGDEVDLQNGTLFLNGVPEQGAYVNGATEPQERTVSYPLTVPEGQVFVLGDNREISLDSRTFGPAALSQVRGRIFTNK